MKFNYSNQLYTELGSFLKGYPEFVFSRKPKSLKNEIPIFVFHSFEPELFEKQLIFLKENSIRTLTINEYVDAITGRIKIPENSILLTIDDARISFWLYGFPLIKKYNMNAVLFIIPGMTTNNGEANPNLEDYWDGKVSLESLKQIDPLDENISNWKELNIMFSSGHVDIEIHTLFHKEVFINKKIVSFITKKTKFIPYNSEASPYLDLNDIGIGYNKEKLTGLPLFTSMPLMKGIDPIEIPSGILEESKSFYNEDPELFESDETRRENIRNKIQNKLNSLHFTYKEAKQSIYSDLKLCQDLITEKISPTAGKHLCLPWTIGSNTVIEICKKLDIKSCFWGVMNNKRINKVGDNPYYSCRIKNDFIFRLPGVNRSSLFSIYEHKLKRRFLKEKVF